MDTGLFVEISLILVVATVVAGMAQLLRQPLIIGHILTGILVGPSVFNIVKSAATVEAFSHIGLSLLLFIVGLGLNPKVIKEVGKVALITGMGQIIFNTIIGFFLVKLLGFATLPALYLAIALAFSSTIIVLKILSDKKESSRLYGKITTGFLLVQDLVAVIVLVAASTILNSSGDLSVVGAALLKGILVSGVLSLLAIHVLPKLTERFAHSQEFLFIFSLGWGLGIATLFGVFGFSLEIGALAAGVALAHTAYAYEIGSRMRPLRDFFIILFFIVLGANITLASFGPALVPALVLSAFVLIGNPLITIVLMSMLGYTRKTSFKAGITVAQISEFSLVLILLGHRAGQLSEVDVAVVTLVGLITMAVSTYMMLYDDQLFAKLAPLLGVLERKQTKADDVRPQSHDIVLFGYKAGGRGFVKAFEKLDKSYLVVDYDPETIDQLKSQNVSCIYGDANDPDFLSELSLNKAKLVIINLTDFATNALIVDQLRQVNPRAIVIAMTKADDKIDDALELYERGASYVMMPRYLSSLKVGSLLRRYELSATKFKAERERHKRILTTVQN